MGWLEGHPRGGGVLRATPSHLWGHLQATIDVGVTYEPLPFILGWLRLAPIQCDIFKIHERCVVVGALPACFFFPKQEEIS
jgi:hypothetical protein